MEGCNYLLALEMEMDPVPGYEIASWERGYGDFAIVPDLATLRRIPWLEATALVLGDVHVARRRHPVQPSPRQVLRRRSSGPPRSASRRWSARSSSSTSSARPSPRRTRRATATSRRRCPYILDYHVLATTYDEPLLRAIRNGMHAAGIRVETSKGEAWPGQQEINFRFADALTMADNHVIYKNGAKEIAFLHGCSITFMAKPFEDWIGNSCHIHSSLFRDGEAAFATDEALFDRWLAGQIACAKELAIFFAPTINSYKRYAAGQLGADDARVGQRQPHLRVPRRRPRDGAARRDADPGRRREPVPRASRR